MNYPERRIEALKIAAPVEDNVPLQLARAIPGTLNPGDPGVSLAHFTKIATAYSYLSASIASSVAVSIAG